jgi:hypothetical protein
VVNGGWVAQLQFIGERFGAGDLKGFGLLPDRAYVAQIFRNDTKIASTWGICDQVRFPPPTGQAGATRLAFCPSGS